MPIIKLAAAIREKPNELYFVIADDPAFPPDLRAWCTQQNIELLNLDSQGGVHRGLFQARNAVALRHVSNKETASTATAIPKAPVQLTPASASEFPLEVPSEELNLFEEMQDLDYWPTEIPTAPTPAIDLRGLSKIDCRTMSTEETIAQLEDINAHDKGVILHVKLAPDTKLNAIEEWCRTNKVTCIANNQTSEQFEIWLQPEPTTNEEGPQP
jgi:TusA-related sulfurtransferase